MMAPAHFVRPAFAALLLGLLATPSLAQMVSSRAANTETVVSAADPFEGPQPGTVRLSAEQREAAIEAGAARPSDVIEGGNGPDHQIHGELGVEVGSGGTRAAYGTALVPLGATGLAAFSFETGQSNYRWRRH